ncbi:MAG: hypothetical protein HC933_19695 [Pleurocapsa sp. SU_196_0]|nr:hypothetical protein [Pleurocapsa sp. SU_196_0]
MPSGKKEDLTFVFRNSYGRRWGSGGYGFVQYGYLSQHLSDALLFVDADLEFPAADTLQRLARGLRFGATEGQPAARGHEGSALEHMLFLRMQPLI